MTIRESEDAYQQLREQLLRGELEEAEFKAEVEKLQFQDYQGDRWKIGWYTGNWYRYDQGQWVQGYPQDRPVAVPGPVAAGGAESTKTRPRSRSLTPYLVTVLIGLLLVASVALLSGSNLNWKARPADDASEVVEATASMSATATLSAAPAEATARPSPTRIAQIAPTASRTTAPLATRQRATPASSAPLATPVEGASPSAAPAERASPSAAPAERASSTATYGPTQAITPTLTATPRQTSPVAPTRPPTISGPTAGRIFFSVYDANPDRRTLDIHVLQVASGQRELMIGQASQPALSPDGRRLAYRSLDAGGRGLWVRELDNGNTWRWIGFHEAEHPTWSPDSQSIAFSSQQESDRRWRLYRTWGTDFDRVRRQGGDIFGRVPTWASDGRIIYWECPQDKCGLYSIHPDGTNLTRLTIHEYDTAPAVSPGGERLAFMSHTSGNWEIYLVNARTPAGEDSGEPAPLTNSPGQDGLPTWSPDGQWLAFVSDRDGSWGLWVMRPDGSAQQKLMDLGGSLTGQVEGIPPTEQHGWAWETMAWGP